MQKKFASATETTHIEPKVVEENSQLQIDLTEVALKIDQDSSKSTIDKSIDDIVRFLYRNDLKVTLYKERAGGRAWYLI